MGCFQKEIKFGIVFLIALISIISFASAFEISSYDYPPQYYKQYDNLTFSYAVYNQSSGCYGCPVGNGLTCLFQLYNSEGEIQFSGFMNYNNPLYSIDIDGTNFTTAGVYPYLVSCNSSAEGGYVKSAFEVTYNGKVPPQDFALVFFIALFLAMIAIETYFIIILVGHFAKGDVDVMDIAKNFAVYFTILSFVNFNSLYFGNEMVASFLNILIPVGAFTNIIIPIVAFIFSMMINAMKKRRTF